MGKKILAVAFLKSADAQSVNLASLYEGTSSTWCVLTSTGTLSRTAAGPRSRGVVCSARGVRARASL